MTEGTRMKNLESQLQQASSATTDCQNRIDQLELGATCSHEAIWALDRQVESSMDGMEWRLEGSIARVRDELGAQMQQFMVMFACQNPVRLSTDFPPREHIEPIL